LGPGQGGIWKGGFSLSLLHDIPSTSWLLAIPGRDTFYPMHSIYTGNYPDDPPDALGSKKQAESNVGYNI